MEMLQRKYNPPMESREATRAWWSQVPHTTHYAYESNVLDFRGLNLDGRDLSGISLDGRCLDDYSGCNCLYKETEFQSSTAQRADFSASQFISAQMSPLYARGAIFKDCTLTGCFLMGIGPRFHTTYEGELTKGNFSDFRDCDFTNVVAIRCGFDRCDFRGARFTNAKFVDCCFNESDLTEVDFGGVSFEGCDFSRAELPASAEVHALVEQGNNRALETIRWKPSA